MKDAYYFSHDSNARHDPKILSMRSVYGSEGYGWYWIIIELMRDQQDYKIKLDKYVWNALAMQLQCPKEMAEKFIVDCIDEFYLFRSDGSSFWSDSLINRMSFKDEKSEKARKSAEKRWGKTSPDQGSIQNSLTSNANAMQTHSECNANAMQTHSECNAIKVKEKKEKEIKNITDDVGTFEQIFDAYTQLRNISPVNVNAIDIDLMQKLVQSGIPPDFIIQSMREVAASKEINSMKYYNKVIRDRWEKELALKEAETSGFDSGNSPKDRGSGETSSGTGYFDQFNFIQNS